MPHGSVPAKRNRRRHGHEHDEGIRWDLGRRVGIPSVPDCDDTCTGFWLDAEARRCIEKSTRSGQAPTVGPPQIQQGCLNLGEGDGIVKVAGPVEDHR